MKLNNILNNLKFYDFKNPETIKKFQEADIELSGIMLKRSRNLKDLCFPVGHGSASLLFVTEDVNKIKLLLSHDNSTTAFYNATDRHGYHVLAKTNNEAKAELIINEYKDKYVLDHIMSAQTFVEANENVKIVDMLIKAGGSPSKGYFGATVLESAQSIEKFKLLLEHGAKINVLTKNDITLIEKIEERSKYHNLYLDELINHKNFDPNFKNNDGQAIVFLLDDKNKLKIIEHKNFDFNTRNNNNEPLLYIFKDNQKILDVLVKKIDITNQNYKDSMPFFYINDIKHIDQLYQYSIRNQLKMKDQNGENVLFSKEISVDKFNYILNKFEKNNDDLKEVIFNGGKDNICLAVSLIKRNEHDKLNSLLNHSPDLVKEYFDEKGNNLFAYVTSIEQINLLHEKYNLPLDHRNKNDGYSILEGMNKCFTDFTTKTFVESLNNKDFDTAIAKMTYMFNKFMPLVNKDSVLNKLHNKPEPVILNNDLKLSP